MAKFIIIVGLLFIATVANAGQRIGDDDDYVCSEQGRFPDNTDDSCKRYHLCSPGRRGIWVKSSYSCPEGTIFDGDAGHCSSNYKCSHYQDSSDSDSDSSSDYDDGDFVCKKRGFYDDKTNPYCSSYYECKANHKGALFAVQYSCPPPSKYDPVAKRCVAHYTCKREFQCKRVGRFDDGSDDNNKRYFLCSKKKNGEYVKTTYTCPLYSRFVQESERCVVPDDSASNELDIHDPNLPVENWDHLDQYVCKKRGYSATTISLRTFYFCDVMSDGKLIKFILSCPPSYLWIDDTNLCTPYK